MYKPISQLNENEKEKRRAEGRAKQKKYGQKYKDFKSMWQLKANMKERKRLDKADALKAKELLSNIIRRNK